MPEPWPQLLNLPYGVAHAMLRDQQLLGLRQGAATGPRWQKLPPGSVRIITDGRLPVATCRAEGLTEASCIMLQQRDRAWCASSPPTQLLLHVCRPACQPESLAEGLVLAPVRSLTCSGAVPVQAEADSNTLELS